MCNHENITFHGRQDFGPGIEPMDLYNCERCHTTVARPITLLLQKGGIMLTEQEQAAIRPLLKRLSSRTLKYMAEDLSGKKPEPPVITIRIRDDQISGVEVQGVPFRGKVRELVTDTENYPEDNLLGEIEYEGLEPVKDEKGLTIIPPELADRFERDQSGELVQITEYEYDNTRENCPLAKSL